MHSPPARSVVAIVISVVFAPLLQLVAEDHGCVCVPCSEAYSSVLYRTFSDQSFVAQVDSIKAFQHGGTCSKIVFFWNLLFQSTCHYSEGQHFLCYTLMSGQLDDGDLVGLLGLSLSGLVLVTASMTVNIALTSRVIFSLCAFSLLQGPWQYLFIGQQGSATWFFIWSLKLKWPPATLRPFSLVLQYFVDHSGVDSPLYTSNIICFSFDALVMGDYHYDLRLKHPWPPPGFCISLIGVALWALFTS
jgi:hypothetical protein